MRQPLLLLAGLLSLTGIGRAVDEAAYRQAVELYREHRFPDAQQAFTALALADPAHADVQAYLGRLAMQRNEPAEAVARLEKAAALKPDDSRIQQWLGDAYGLSALKAGLFAKMGWAGKCRVAYEKAVTLDPANTKARISLINFYLQAPGIAGGSPEKALEQAQEVKKTDVKQGAYLMANVHAATKHYDLAFAALEEVLRQEPTDYATLFHYGRLAAVSGQRLDEGLKALRQCLDMAAPANQPGPAQVHWRIGNILEKMDDKAAARAAYEAAIRLDPKFSQASDALKKM